MRNIALTLQYLGTAYHGWQVQKTVTTVGQTLEEAAAAVSAIRCRPAAAARTPASMRGCTSPISGPPRAFPATGAAVRAQYAPARGYRRYERHGGP